MPFADNRVPIVPEVRDQMDSCWSELVRDGDELDRHRKLAPDDGVDMPTQRPQYGREVLRCLVTAGLVFDQPR